MKKIVVLSLIIVILLLGYFLSRYFNKKIQTPPTGSQTTVSLTLNQDNALSPEVSKTNTPQSSFVDPVTNFSQRVTKKPFGIFITPQNSPISPERFTGYHTGADAEYQDVTDDVAVFAIADGKVVLSETVSGYGGVFMIEFDLNGSKHTALYGHIRPSNLPKSGQAIKKGEQIGLLGTGYSKETDGERRHLHFAILSDDRLDIKGYVQTKLQLSGWIDPLTII